ncbi:hypothetical protein GJ744_008175 [Endocarpon pusillum]|uniref:C2H2-type domain-containing protein n=1 Tax=Endocarpon pusillum TaxID=364733 RepID=A0A8H7ALI2_9EURO|nr:hypothetical protein GJ744_008175 [Endocarpon pusillum]
MISQISNSEPELFSTQCRGAQAIYNSRKVCWFRDRIRRAPNRGDVEASHRPLANADISSLHELSGLSYASPPAHELSGLSDASPPTYELSGLSDASPPTHELSGLSDASPPTYELSGLSDASPPTLELSGLSDASLPTYELSGLSYASPQTHELSGLSYTSPQTHELSGLSYTSSQTVGTSATASTSPATSQTKKRKRREVRKGPRRDASGDEASEARKCPYCDQTFSGAVCDQKSNLKRHIGHKHPHPGKRAPYVCSKCGDRFVRSDYLSTHKKKC